jgi:PleD family two-component response regulator
MPRCDIDGVCRVKKVPSVLIVAVSQYRTNRARFLRVMLEHRGAKTIEADRPEDAIPLAARLRPNLIIRDAESEQSRTGEPTNDLRDVARRNDTPIVILGKVRQLGGPIPPHQIYRQALPLRSPHP